MELLNPLTLAAMAAMGFLAAFIDSVVGGGGLISLPTLMWAGIPMHHALGTNKMASTMGACMGAFTFFRSGKMDKKALRLLFPLSFLGAVGGVLLVQQVPPDFLRPLVVVMLVSIALYSIFHRGWGSNTVVPKVSHRMIIFSRFGIFALGAYDGFFGPGTGSFMLFLFLLMGYGFVNAAANARAANFASNIAAVIAFAYLGLVDYAYAIPMGLGMVAGAYCGARMAIAKGAAYVRPLFITVTIVLIGKQLLDLYR